MMLLRIETGETLMGAKITGPNGGQIDCSKLFFEGDANGNLNWCILEIPLVSLKATAEATLFAVDVDGKKFVLMEVEEALRLRALDTAQKGK